VTYRVIIQPPAADDIDSAYLWIAERNPDAAVSWFNRMEAAVQTLSKHPQRCPLAEENRYFEREIR
jgi:plasmid stabilization system protein ParE